MTKKLAALFLTSSLLCVPAHSREIAKVQVPESITVAEQPLVLNGAGVRKRFFVRVYVGALYLKDRQSTVEGVLGAPGPKSVRLHFVYDEVQAAKLVDAWNEGFRNNTSEAEFIALAPRIAEFNRLFTTMVKGETIRLDLLPDGSTQVWINDQLKGTIPGADFQRALLKIWLGEKPADDGLKQAMLGTP